VRSSANLRTEAEAEPKQPGRPAWRNAAGLAGLGALVFAATFELSRSFAGPQRLSAPPSAPQLVTQLSPATQAPSPAGVVPRDPARGTEPVGVAAPTRAAAPRTAATVNSTNAARARSKPTRLVRPAPARPVPVTERPRVLTQPAPLKAAQAPQRTAASSDKLEDIHMGSDLRVLRGRAAASVDSEDPYR
jgi:hypothetical protein